MSNIKKDHAVGTGTGAAAGSLVGAGVGAAGGPIGMAAGAVIGGVAGAAAGDSVAEAVNPTTFADHWKRNYKSASYHKSDREWNDYEPAYMLGYTAHAKHRGSGKFADSQAQAKSAWEATKGKSRLAWHEAKDAVRDGWNFVERAIPGDFDGDGN